MSDRLWHHVSVIITYQLDSHSKNKKYVMDHSSISDCSKDLPISTADFRADGCEMVPRIAQPQT
jgi:hypothetical protein